jgi:hypothetical protein
MPSCILFSATIISHDREFVIRRFLETFKHEFSDSDIYIGINPISIPNLESIILEYNLNVQMTRADVSLYTESDASGFQAAIKLLYKSGNQYDNYWFIHTKSGVNVHSDYLREWYINNFINNRSSIELNMKDMGMGSYGMLGLEYDNSRHYTETDTDISLWNNEISKFLPCTHAHFFYIHTIYVITSGPMLNFLSLISDLWFNSKLNRYYFEGVFPFIVSRSGYFPYLENRISATGLDLSTLQLKWMVENQLYHKYSHLFDQFKTNYNFNQLTPPSIYVNSYS